MAEDCRPPLAVVAADSLEHAGPVVETVGEHVDVGLVPGDEIAVHPDQLDLLHRHSSIARGRWREYADPRVPSQALGRGTDRGAFVGSGPTKAPRAGQARRLGRSCRLSADESAPHRLARSGEAVE